MGLRDELVALGIPIPEELPIDRLAEMLGERPCRNTLSLVGLSTVLFFAAEKQHNPKVRDIYDALIYCATAISVGYADIFPRTPVGKVLGAILMTLGPALAARTVEGPRTQRHDGTQQQILQTLRQILQQLQTAPVATPPGAADTAAN
ncbi:ion channel [Fontivita pretiosa]|uniref:ion channel n=1 Tax=Fontivita pretiosa TaxID=2989684 RepID=UPI003D171E1B